jgi:hypothetical protein
LGQSLQLSPSSRLSLSKIASPCPVCRFPFLRIVVFSFCQLTPTDNCGWMAEFNRRAFRGVGASTSSSCPSSTCL